MARTRPPATSSASSSPLRPGAPRVAPASRPETLPARITEPSPVLSGGPNVGRGVIPESHQLPPHQTKMDRVTGHLAALSADLREWTELQIELQKRKLEGVQAQIERFQHFAGAAGFFLPALVLGVTGIMFLLVALAFGIGKLVGSLGAGFFLTALLLLVPAGVLGWLGMKKVREAQELAAEARRLERDQKHRDRDDIAATERAAATNAAV